MNLSQIVKLKPKINKINLLSFFIYKIKLTKNKKKKKNKNFLFLKDNLIYQIHHKYL